MRISPFTRYTLRTIALIYLFVLLIVPVGLIFWRSFEHGFGQFWEWITTPAAIAARASQAAVGAAAGTGSRRALLQRAAAAAELGMGGIYVREEHGGSGLGAVEAGASGYLLKDAPPHEPPPSPDDAASPASSTRRPETSPLRAASTTGGTGASIEVESSGS